MGRLPRRRLIGQATAAAVAMLVRAPSAGAQSAGFPAKPIRILVGFAAGGNSDFIARLLASEIKGYSSTLLVENRAGAGGRVALDAL